MKRVHSAPVPGHEQRTFSVAELGPDYSGRAGWGTGTVDSDHPVVVAATMHWTDASEAYSAQVGGSTVLWAPGLYRQNNADESWERSQVSVQNLGDTDTDVLAEFLNPDGSVAHWLLDSIPNKGAACYDTGDAWAIAVPALGLLQLDLKQGGDLPPEALAALGSDFRSSLVVTPGQGLAVVGAAGTFQPGEGRASGYAGFPVP